MKKSSAPDTTNHTILIIDDTPANLGIMAEFLQQRGLMVAIAQDGEEGLQRAEFVQPGLILLDVMMPGMDGFEVCRRLKANPRTREIPVIFMTALSEQDDKVNGFAAGGVDYVTKPLEMMEVTARVNAHLKLYALQRLATAQNAQLLRHRENLELQVAQRTAELQESNRLLREEIGVRDQNEMLIRERLELEHRLSSLAANIPGFLYTFRVTPDGQFSFPFVSEGVRDLFGLSPDDVVTDRSALHRLTHPDDRLHIDKTIDNAARDRSIFLCEFRILHPIKGETWIEARAMPEPESEPDGSVLWYGVMHDISARHCLENALKASEAKHRIVFESANDGIFLHRIAEIDGVLEFVLHDLNQKGCELWGYSREDILSNNFDLLAMNNPPYSFAEARRRNLLAAAGQAQMFDWQLVRGDGSKIWGEVNLRRIQIGGEHFLLAVMRDVNERKLMEAELRTREREFRELVESSPDTIARYDRDFRRVYANPKLVASMGGDLLRILGTRPEEFPGGPSARAYQTNIEEVFDRAERRDFELHWQAEGVEFCTQIRMTPEFDRLGHVVHVLAVGRDISEIDQYRKKVHHQAFFDSLTGLPNRLLLSDRISQTIADAAYHGQQFGLMLLDLDHFKEINDTLGHGVGDRVLCETAKRVQGCVRIYDTVARLGGDEFAVLLPDVRKGDDLATIADKILRELAEPFLIEGRELFITSSIGIALYPGDSTEIDALYKYADSAMYQAKRMGRNNFQFYAKEFTARSLERMEVEVALRKARKNGELVLYFQPLIELQTGRVTGAEALLRWNRPGHGVVTPDRFITIAEESGLIVDIGEWVLLTACATAVEWNRERAMPLRLAVNLSTRQFIRNDLVGSVRRILAETGCKAEWLKLEITESLLLEDSSEVAAMLAALHGMGLSISIDDFGTGYSALSYLNRFPVSQIKIDRSFVKGIIEQRDKRELVKAMLSIAAALRLEVVAEGVETAEQAEYLLAHGCPLAQGYLFGKPMPRAVFETLLESDVSA